MTFRLRIARPRETPNGARPESFELTVSATLLFESFRAGGRPVTIGGHECADRLDALQRIVEHETVHLVEQLRWRDTNCSGSRFQAIARRLFGHTDHRHALVTPRERAVELGLKAGQRVVFEFEGVRHEGILSRVTKRATVLVPHPDGELMSDGNTIAAMNGVSEVIERLDGVEPGEVGIPLVAFAELLYGAYRSRRRVENLDRIRRLRHSIETLPLTDEVVGRYVPQARAASSPSSSPTRRYGMPRRARWSR